VKNLMAEKIKSINAKNRKCDRISSVRNRRRDRQKSGKQRSRRHDRAVRPAARCTTDFPRTEHRYKRDSYIKANRRPDAGSQHGKQNQRPYNTRNDPLLHRATLLLSTKFSYLTAPNRRLRVWYSAIARSNCSGPKSGHRTSRNTSSEYADCHNRKLESRNSPLGRTIRSGSGSSGQ